MATQTDVQRICRALPEVQEQTSSTGELSWAVRGKKFAWERPLRASDRAALGDEAPTGPVLGVRTADDGAKLELVATVSGCFTTPHFDGYPAILVALDDIAADELAEVITDGWLAKAPKRLAAEFLGR